ncbi:TonB-dependent siderophore receptor [Magnetospirillum aberrantis]|uniref:TonB-dependent siderophore receptor n=1 Tax=Magnetospirillum aberrantis SpK TaxID=908842 RepID=A0A7C9UXE2_9PROT|nr:TonB-dependent receptor [Magnetospirillum aberrantis]NFV78834.1 TonB-dependent siderophore receptor [Magnetospirillum aberrantis SpK]
MVSGLACWRGLAAALLGGTALATLVVVPAAMAAEATQVAQAGDVRSFDIPAGPLGRALTAFGEASGLKVLVPSALLQNRNTAGVSGTLSPERALVQLLGGTGLTWRYTDSGVVTLEAVPAQDGAMELGPVTVEGQARALSATTEGSGSYTSRVATVGSKMPATLREIPQSVTVVTRQRMDDQNMQRLEDAMRATTGMTIATNDNGRSSIFVRGYELDNYLVDGLPTSLSSIYGTQPDLAMFDRVEVLRGPSGLFGGTGEPGGTVNLARKRALDHAAASGSFTYGSWNAYEAMADATGPLVSSGRVRGRVVASYLDKDSFIDVNHNTGKLGYGTLEFDLTPATTLSLALNRQERDITPTNGLPAYADGRLLNVDRSTYYGADWNRFESASNEALAELKHTFDDGGFAQVSARYVDRWADMKYAYSGSAVSAADTTSTMAVLARNYDEQTLSLDGHLSKPFTAFGLTHNALVGADYRRYEQTLWSTGNSSYAWTSNVNSPNTTGFAETYPAQTSGTRTVPEQYSVYGQLRLKVAEPLTLIGGGRLSYYHQDVTNLVNNTTTSLDVNAETTPYAAVVFDVTKQVSLYASYTEIFQPQTGTLSSGAMPKPRVGNQYETGVKGEFLEGRLNTHLGVFRIRDENRLINDPANATYKVAAGEAESKGLEAEISGALTPEWQVFAGYSYVLTKFLKGDGATAVEGQPVSTLTPKHTVTLWTKYTFGEGSPLEGFNVGGGARMLSAFYNQVGAVRWYQDGYTVVDGQVGYQLTDNLDLTLTVNNVFDEEYYSRVGSSSVFNFYGEPRSYWLKLGAKF